MGIVFNILFMNITMRLLWNQFRTIIITLSQHKWISSQISPAIFKQMLVLRPIQFHVIIMILLWVRFWCLCNKRILIDDINSWTSFGVDVQISFLKQGQTITVFAFGLNIYAIIHITISVQPAFCNHCRWFWWFRMHNRRAYPRLLHLRNHHIWKLVINGSHRVMPIPFNLTQYLLIKPILPNIVIFAQLWIEFAFSLIIQHLSI